MLEYFPVYEMILDYPHAPYKVGTLVTTDANIWMSKNICLIGKSVEEYPHIFKQITKEEFEQLKNKKK